MGAVTVGAAQTSARADFADLFATHRGEALRLAYLLCGDSHRAEDAVSEVFAKMFRGWRHGKIAQPRAYVRRAVVNEVNSRFRRLALERREAGRRHGDDRGARAATDDVVERDEILRALAALPARQRTAIVLRYYADLSEADTAAAMNVSVGTVKSCVSRGLARLRTLIHEEVG